MYWRIEGVLPKITKEIQLEINQYKYQREGRIFSVGRK